MCTARQVASLFAGQSHRIDVIHWIIVAIAEEIVIARVEQFWIFAHEPAQLRVIRPRAILVEVKGRSRVRGPIRGLILTPSLPLSSPVTLTGLTVHLAVSPLARFPPREQEPVIVEGSCARAPARAIAAGRAN